MEKHDRSPLTLTEASALLQDLDRQRKQGRITGIAYRNRRERLLARITEAAPQPLAPRDTKQYRYLTRRQLQAVMPAPAPRPPPLEHGRAALDLYKKQQRRDEREAMDDFIVYSDDDVEGEDDDDISAYIEDEEDGVNESGAEKEFIEPMMKERSEPVTTTATTKLADVQDTKETEAQREMREKLAHFESVKVQYRPMFPDKRAKVIDIDFVGPSLCSNNTSQ
jgi:hypothetical protein